MFRPPPVRRRNAARPLATLAPADAPPSPPAAPALTWEKDTADEWTLLRDGEPVADLSRAYPLKWGAVGHGRIADRSKPKHWTLAAWGSERPSVTPCPEGSTIPVAKAAAEAIVRSWK